MQKRFKRVAVLMGGPSSERQVSLASGAAVAKALQSRGYDVLEIDQPGREVLIPGGVEAVFIALHGTFGEDGQLQEILQRRGMPYTGSGPEASRSAFDKLVSKSIFERAALNVPRYEVLRPGMRRTLPLPVVVKPPREGSSVGLSRVRTEAEWEQALELGFRHDKELLVEAFIPGAELTVGLVADQVLPVVEIRAPDGWYNYTAKYTKGMTEYLVPAPIPAPVARQCQEMALGAYQALGCRGMGRVDIRLTPDGVPFVLEMNTIPGFTETSLLPKAARAAGIDFPELCERILNLAAV